MNCKICNIPAPAHELREGACLDCWMKASKSSTDELNRVCEAMKVPTGAKRDAWAAMLSEHYENCAMPKCTNKRSEGVFHDHFCMPCYLNGFAKAWQRLLKMNESKKAVDKQL